MDQVEAEKLIGDLEIAVDRLRSLFEQYFMGIEKIEPSVPRKDVDRRIQVLRKEQIRNTALRFRFQMILQRYNTYQTHWQRICREIDGGTYKRHILRAERRFATPTSRSSRPPPPSSASTDAQGAFASMAALASGPATEPAPPPDMPETMFRPAPGDPLPPDLAAELAELEAEFAPTTMNLQVEMEEKAATRSPQRVWRKVESPALPTAEHPRGAVPARSPQPATPASPQPPAPRSAVTATHPTKTPTGEITDERMRQLYAQYIDARRRRNEGPTAPSYEMIAESLRNSSDKLLKKHGKPVDFEVTVYDGRTVLRPIVKPPSK